MQYFAAHAQCAAATWVTVRGLLATYLSPRELVVCCSIAGKFRSLSVKQPILRFEAVLSVTAAAGQWIKSLSQ